MFNIRYLDDFEYSQISRNVYGTFYVECEGEVFPDSQWTDFPIIVLRMWCENIIASIANAKESEFQLFFFDGPFSIECKKELDKVKMKFWDRGKEKVCIETVIDIWGLVHSVYKTSTELLDKLKGTISFPINDEEQLRRLLEKLKEFNNVLQKGKG